MTIHTLDIPDDPAQLPRWLERQLVSLDLAAVVAELSAVHGTAAPSGPSIHEILGDQLKSILIRGLSGISPRTIGYLMLRPQLLLELQELILNSGGPYWDQAGQSTDEAAKLLDRGRQGLEQFLATQTSRSKSTESAGPAQQLATAAQSPALAQSDRAQIAPRQPASWHRHPAVVSFATAAAVLFGVFVYERNLRPIDSTGHVASTTAWGWNKPGAIPAIESPDAYLNALADAAAEWFDQRPTDAAGLAKRIGEFRQGCSTLLLADHKPLSEADRDWLLERCRTWAGKLDAHLAAAESTSDIVKVRSEADETINKLIDALRTRAQIEV